MFAYPKKLLAYFEDHSHVTDVRTLAEWRYLIMNWGYNHLTRCVVFAIRQQAFCYFIFCIHTYYHVCMFVCFIYVYIEF